MATKKKDGGGPVGTKSRIPDSEAGRPEVRAREAGAVITPAQTENHAQLRLLEQGLHLFQSARFGEAREFFAKAAAGPQSPVALTARNHMLVCDRRTQAPALALQTGDDHYHYAVERLNARDPETACKHLELAVALKPDCEYILYALAAALALSGDSARACANLKRAIQGNPRNRTAARSDPDFSGLNHDPEFIGICFPERG